MLYIYQRPRERSCAGASYVHRQLSNKQLPRKEPANSAQRGQSRQVGALVRYSAASCDRPIELASLN